MSGLRREAQRLLDHRMLATGLPTVGESLERLAATLLDAAHTLQNQDGCLDAALQLDRRGVLVAGRP